MLNRKPRSARRSVLLLVLLGAVYPALLWMLVPTFGSATALVSLLFTAATTWVLGSRLGIVLVLVNFGENLLVFTALKSLPSMSDYSANRDILGIGLNILIVLGINYLRRIVSYLEAQTRRLSQLEAAMKNTREAIVITDAEWQDDNVQVLFANAAYHRLLGRSPLEVLDTPPLTYLGVPRYDPRMDLIRRALHNFETFSGQMHTTTPTGDELDIDLSIDTIQDAHGRPSSLVMVLRDISAFKRLERELSHRAHHDALTGLPNRVLFEDRLVQTIAHSERYGRLFTVMFLDLDGFKDVNDTLGHDAGDELLIKVAGRLKQKLRTSDTVARLGGDEFTVIVPIQDASHAKIVADKLLSAFEAPFSIAGQSLTIQASLGVSVYPHDGTDASTLQKHADIAMYHVKNSGKNDAHMFSEQMQVQGLQGLD
jgi:diguanylate cyclase (GGDEF)-like protein/PAS domain S-box-containing protein